MDTITQTNDFVVEDLGVHDVDVYDLEVQDTHRFFANGILVHNSTYLDLTPMVNKFCAGKTKEQIIDFLDEVANTKLQDVIQDSYNTFALFTNAFENHMIMKREVIGASIFTAKKRYVMEVWDNEGVRHKEPEYKVTGLQAVQSTTPEFCRKAIKGMFPIAFEKDEGRMHDYIEQVRDEFMELSYYDIAMPKGVNDIEKWITEDGFLPRTPGHVRAAIRFNRLLESCDLVNKVDPIQSGDKIRMVMLNEPNPTGGDRIAFTNFLPEEMGIVKYVDYNTQFEKTFLKGARTILDVLGWTTEAQASLEDFWT